MNLITYVATNLQMTFIVIFAIFTLASLGAIWLGLKNYLGDKVAINDIFKDKNRLMLLGVVGAIISFTIFATLLGLSLGNGDGPALALTIVGSFFFATILLAFVLSFVIHFYKLNPAKYNHKISFLVVVFSGVLSFITLFMMLDGFVYLDIITFPLLSKIYFNVETGQGIAFYALFILAGALLSLALSDHEMYKKYKRHGMLESVFYVAFPAGIVGARIWFVIGDWYRFADNPIRMFYIWEGGLAIMGGAILGIIAGVLFVKYKKKEINILFAADVIVPTILLAQAVGRWGNFFNQEVYGAALPNLDAYFFLPAFVKENMFIEGSYRVPLFFIESMTNIAGYFAIRYGIGHGLKKYRQPLDMAFSYLIWYGLTRVIMEPLRDSTYNMGTDGQWSYIWGYVMMAGGILLIVGNHIYNHYQAKKINTEPNGDQGQLK